VWRYPLVLLALASVAAPILIHILVQRRAERFAFPTLRFIAPTRLAAIRRHLLEDAALLAVRIAMLAAAVIALAGPLLVTASRRHRWDQQIVRAVVIDERNNPPPSPGLALGGTGSGIIHILGRSPGVVEQKAFDAEVLGDGVRRALAWLDTEPPGRRELVIRSPFPIESLTDADIAEIPSAVGIRFERQGVLARTRTVPGNTVLTSAGSQHQIVTLDGMETLVTDPGTAGAGDWPIEISASETAQPTLDAAVVAVRTERVWAAPADRRARLIVVDRAAALSRDLDAAGSVQQPWMAAAISRIANDVDLKTAAAAVAAGSSDPRLGSAPWHALTFAADGRPLIVAAASDGRLIVVSAAGAHELITPLLMRAMANAIAEPVDLRPAEVTPIREALLRRWSREAEPAAPPKIDSIVNDDRRWFWLAALVLLAIETWMRRSRTAAVTEAKEQSRVA
jgi:hypothetical protein